MMTRAVALELYAKWPFGFWCLYFAFAVNVLALSQL